MSGRHCIAVFVSVCALWAYAPVGPAAADAIKLDIHIDDPGPFPAGVGGFIDFSVSVQLLDTEGDGPDTQGVSHAQWNVVLDGDGTRMPWMMPASTGEIGYEGWEAWVNHSRYEDSPAPEERFVGGFGLGSFGEGIPNATGGWNGVFYGTGLQWFADNQPNAPGLQPETLAGIGYGERPAGGVWTLSEGQIPIPTEPGNYGMELIFTFAYIIASDADLTVNHDPFDNWTLPVPPEQQLGDSFSYTVLPEPGSVFFGAISAALLLCRRRAHSRG